MRRFEGWRTVPGAVDFSTIHRKTFSGKCFFFVGICHMFYEIKILLGLNLIEQQRERKRSFVSFYFRVNCAPKWTKIKIWRPLRHCLSPCLFLLISNSSYNIAFCAFYIIPSLVFMVLHYTTYFSGSC